MLNPPSRTSFTALVKVVDRLLFCMLQLLREGLFKIRRFPSVSAYAFRIANASLPFPLTLAFLSYFCKRGTLGDCQHRNTAEKNNEHRITAKKVDETPTPRFNFCPTI